MKTDRMPIVSGQSVDDPRVWLDLTLTKEGRLDVGRASHGGEELDVKDTDVNYEDLLKTAQKAGPVRADRDTGRILLMLTMAGTIVAEYECDVRGTYRAHLGFYDIAKDTLSLLEFVEGPEREE